MNLQKTEGQYDSEVSRCRDLFEKKMQDYGTAWRILRLPSLIDQLYIKANRIRTLEEGETQKIGDSIQSEYIGIVNYAIMALIQIEMGSAEDPRMKENAVMSLYDKYVRVARNLMLAKNHDYGEAWRMMQRSSLTDLILMKLLRLKSIYANDGQTLVSEGMDANFLDMVNYSLFALIKIEETEKTELV